MVLRELPEYVRGMRHPSRVLLAVGDAWHSIGPVAVLAAAGLTVADLADWPILLAALVAQIVMDDLVSTLREWAGLGISPRLQPSLLGWVTLVDVLLSPVGLLAAMAAADRAVHRPARAPARRSAVRLLARAQRARAPGDRAEPRLPRHDAPAERRARGRRRVHRLPQPQRGLAVRRGGGRDGARTRRAPQRRVRRPAPRRRQDRRAQGDHQQARAAHRRRVARDQDAHDRGPADARPGRRSVEPRRPHGALLTREVGRHAATPTASSATRSRSARRSSAAATPSTR